MEGMSADPRLGGQDPALCGISPGDGASSKQWMGRGEWILLLDSTGATGVWSNDLLGIVADYVMGHEFVCPPEALGLMAVTEDGQTCSLANNHANISFRQDTWMPCHSRFPISLADSCSFTVKLLGGLPPRNYLRSIDEWSICVGLVNPLRATSLSGDVFDAFGSDAIMLFADGDALVNGAMQSIFSTPWVDNSILTVKVDNISSDKPTICFTVNGTEYPISWPCPISSTPKTWIPTVGMRLGVAGKLNTNSFSILS